MRFFEVLLVAAMLAFAWWTVVTGRPRRPVGDLVGIVLVGGVAGAQYLLEGYRWQLVPLYVVAGVIVVVSVWDLASPTDSSDERRRNVGGAVWASLGIALLVALPVALPVVDVPGDPAQPVGTLSYVAIDPDRTEMYGPAPGGPRELAIQIWYPVESVDGVDMAPWVDNVDSLAPTAAAYLGFPEFFLDHLALSATNSFLGATAADGGFPVIVYSHGWGGFRSVALNQMEALAAEGFVVVAVDHTYAALSATLADGSQAALDVRALPDEADVGPEEYARARETLSAVFAADLEFVLDQLPLLQSGVMPRLEPIAGHLDLGRIGLLGHSTGGGAAVTVCWRDDRCDAVLGQDPWLEPISPDILSQGLEVPMLALRSEEWLARPNDELVAELAANSPMVTLAHINGTVHRDFTVLPALSPLSSVAGLSGPLATDRTFELVNAVNVAFFSHHLSDGAPLERVTAGYSELEFGG